jgi:hypothetical protein
LRRSDIYCDRSSSAERLLPLYLLSKAESYAFCFLYLEDLLKGPYLDSPFVLTIHFPDSAFTWTHTVPHKEALDSFVPPQKPWKTRWRCKRCGCCVASHNSKANKWSVWGTQLERDEEGKIIGWDGVKPTAHMFYGTRILDINDGLLKWDGYEGQSTGIYI